MYNVSDKELLNIRNIIFLDYGLPSLRANGFEESPFLGAWFGRDNLKDFTYQLCRISQESYLEMITVFINRGDKWIHVILNIFELTPKVVLLDNLKGREGRKFYLAPNFKTQMELRDDDYKGIPLIHLIFYPEHKIGCYFSKSGFERKVKNLERLINRDMENIDSFVKRWHEIHKPARTDWEGNRIDNHIPDPDVITGVDPFAKADKSSRNGNNVDLLKLGSLLFPGQEADYNEFVGSFQIDRRSFFTKNKDLLYQYDYLDLENLSAFEVIFIFGDKENHVSNIDWRGEENEREIEEFIEGRLGLPVDWHHTDKVRAEIDEDDQVDGEFIKSLFKSVDRDLAVINKKILFYEFNSDSYQFSVVDKSAFNALSSKFEKNFHGAEKLK